MRVLLAPLAVFLSAALGCVYPDADDKPTYASDSAFTRPWATCLVTSAEAKDDGSAEPSMIAEAVAEECAPDLLSAFRRQITDEDKRKAYALTAEKAEALVLSNRRDRASGMALARGSLEASEPLSPGAYGMGMSTR